MPRCQSDLVGISIANVRDKIPVSLRINFFLEFMPWEKNIRIGTTRKNARHWRRRRRRCDKIGLLRNVAIKKPLSATRHENVHAQGN